MKGFVLPAGRAISRTRDRYVVRYSVMVVACRDRIGKTEAMFEYIALQAVAVDFIVLKIRRPIPGALNMPVKRRLRHRPKKPISKPKHNCPTSKWRAVTDYVAFRMLHPDERPYDGAQKICKPLRVAVTPQCLGQWYKKYR